MTQLLLLSNSTNPGTPYLSWAREHLAEFLTGVRSLLFVPYAGVRLGWDQYTTLAASALAPLGIEVQGIHRAGRAEQAVRDAGALAVGGGNTFHLLKHLQEQGLIGPIRERVAGGARYVGWSAGSNVACPTIRTTNDMPIVEPAGFRGLALVPFQINPHYTDAVVPNHGGESRQERLAEFVAANPRTWVVGLREGSLIRANGADLRLGGGTPATVFGAGEPVDHAPGADLSFLREPPA
jgi:dipeptidase E